MINATGVVLHTNLGRAAAVRGCRRRARGRGGATDVELDLATGRRARRGRGALAALAAAVPAAEAVHVVNNGAAAAGARRHRARPGPGDRGQPRASSSRSATGSGCPTCWRRPARGCARSAPRTAPTWPTTRTPSARTPGSSSRSTRRTSSSAASRRPSRWASSRRRLGVPVVVDIGSGLLAPEPLLPGEPDAARPWRPVPTWSPPAATSCSAARRRGCCSAARTSSSGCAGTRSPGRCAWTSSPWPRSRPPSPAPGRRRRPRCTPTRRSSAERACALAARLGAAGVRASAVQSARWSAAAGRRAHLAVGRGGARRRARRRRCGPASRPSWAGSSAAGCLLDLRSVAPADDDAIAAAVLAVAGAAEPADARRRHRRARRPRQVHAGARADRDGAGPVRGGAPPGDDHRPRLRLDRPCPAARWSRSWTCRGTSASSRRCSPASARCPPCCWSSPPTKGGCRRRPSTSPRSTPSASGTPCSR